MKTIAIAAVFAAGFGTGIWAAGQTQQAPSLTAERVTWIGGVFFQAKDPKTPRAWYQEKLGIPMQEGSNFGLFLWRERQDSSREGTTVWGLFPETTKYFAPSAAPFMINYASGTSRRCSRNSGPPVSRPRAKSLKTSTASSSGSSTLRVTRSSSGSRSRGTDRRRAGRERTAVLIRERATGSGLQILLETDGRLFIHEFYAHNN
jgi:hypothetical protein